MTLSTTSFGWLRDGIGNTAAAREIESKLDVLPSATAYFVHPNGTNVNGTSWADAFTTVQEAINNASSGDTVYLAPSEYNEDVTCTLSQLAIIGVGPKHSCRITGTSAGTATALTLSGVQDVTLANLNLEGRAGGAGLFLSGLGRRIAALGCKLHGGSHGTNKGLKIDSLATQTGDITIDGCVIGYSVDGIYYEITTGGDLAFNMRFTNNSFENCSGSWIKFVSAANDFRFEGNSGTNTAGTEPTVFLDLDTTSTNGLVAGNRFPTDVFDSTDFAIATGVKFVDNICETEAPSYNVGGTSGRPD
jgi:hypothetical protein